MAARGIPQERWEVDAWARDLGRAHELGGYRRAYKAVGRSGRKGRGIFLTGLGLLPGLALASQAAGTARATLFAIAGAIIALGLVLIRTAPPEKADWIFLYADGAAQIAAGDAAPRIVPWSLLGQVLKKYSRGTEDADPKLQTLRVVGRNGTAITATAGEYRWIGRLDRDIDGVVTERRLPAAIERYHGGAPVAFGSLTVSPDAIAWAGSGSRTVWAEIRSVLVTEYAIELTTSSARRRQRILLDDVPDACVAVLLIREAAARHGIPVNGSPAPAALPPAGRRGSVDGIALLSPAEVSDVFGWPMEAVGGPAAGRLAARFQDGGATLSLAVRNRSALDPPVARALGRAVPGIDTAWLLSADRTAVVLAGRVTARLDLAGLPPPARAAVLIPLARIVAARLTGFSQSA